MLTTSIMLRITSGRNTNKKDKAILLSCATLYTATHPAVMAMTTIRMHNSSTTVWNLNLRQQNSVLLRVVKTSKHK